MMTRFRLFGLAMLASLGLATTANAGLLPVTVTTLSDGDFYRWTYSIVLPTDSQLRSGDFFTIYDFGGLVANSNSQPANWDFELSSQDGTPPGVEPDDNPAIPNLTWRYNGPTIASGSTGLGNFWALSHFSDSTSSFFTARTHTTSDGTLDTNITDTTVPVPTGPGDPNTVPEPATILLAGLGLPLVGLGRRVLRKS